MTVECYKCQECGEDARLEDWAESEVDCDLCGGHPAFVCPNCKAICDVVFENMKPQKVYTEAEQP